MMRRKSTLEVAHHIYQEVASWIDARISGNVYPFDCRPMDSHDEDAIIIVSTATADQIQEGRAKINIYVADIDNGSGRNVPNIERLQEIARLDEDIVNALNESANRDYLWDLSQATEVVADTAIGQHFVNISLSFKSTTF